MDELTIAYLAIGAEKQLNGMSKDERKDLLIDRFGGDHVGAIQMVVDNAEFLDSFWEKHQELEDVSFYYEVAEPFGASFVISSKDQTPHEILKNVLRIALDEKSFSRIYS
ncbi:MAG: hypothetical protein PHX24_03550 [Acidithiobacillus sp.]|nr:hypothetical protein [Acidithiobacillus sp.]